MLISYDPNKNASNLSQGRTSFERVKDFDFSSATVVEDTRFDYPERRFQALGYIDGRLHMLVFTPIEGGIHVISLRKANPREIRRYEQANQQPD
jgi:uncharacterized DUF497 family protein